MASFNKVLLMGNLTRDPQLKYLPSQTAVCEFGIAASRKFRTQGGEDREEVCFVDCSAFGRTGEVINQYMQKGRPIFVEGRLKFDSWEDRQGGGKRSKLSVVVDNFQFIGGRDDGGGGGGGGGGGNYNRGRSNQGPSDDYGNDRSPPPQRREQPQRQQAQANEPFDDGEQFGEDDIPF